MMSQEALSAYERAGRIAAAALQYGAKQIKVGANMRDVLDSVEVFIAEQGAKPAFPAQSSINDVAAHCCPRDDEDLIYRDGDLVKLDVGVHVDGYVADNALTISLGGKDDDLCAAVQEALAAAHAILKPGCTPHAIGTVVETTLKSKGFLPIRNLTGHGVDRYEIHASPSIPNYPSGDMEPLQAGDVIAIEPFGTKGASGMIINHGAATIFSLVKPRPVRTPYAREALALMQTYDGLPFTTRWLTRELGGKALLALNEIKKAGMLIEHPPLVERSNGVVAQFEHTFLITETGATILTKF